MQHNLKFYYNKSLISSTIPALYRWLLMVLHTSIFPCSLIRQSSMHKQQHLRQLPFCNSVQSAEVCSMHVFSRRCTYSQEEMFDAEVHVLILLIILWLFCQKNLQLNSTTSFKPLFMMQCARDQRNTKQIWKLKKYIISYLIQ